MGENPSVAPAHHDFGVGQVGDHLTHRPLARTRLHVDEACPPPWQVLSMCRRSTPEPSAGSSSPEQIEQILLIGGRLGNRVRGGIVDVHRRNLPVRAEDRFLPSGGMFMEQCRDG